MDESRILDKQFIAQNLEAALKAAYFALGYQPTEDLVDYVYSMYCEQIPEYDDEGSVAVERVCR